MPNRIVTDEELLEHVPYAPKSARQMDIERVMDMPHATAFVRLEALELKGLVCSIRRSQQHRTYYRPTDAEDEHWLDALKTELRWLDDLK